MDKTAITFEFPPAEWDKDYRPVIQGEAVRQQVEQIARLLTLRYEKALRRLDTRPPMH